MAEAVTQEPEDTGGGTNDMGCRIAIDSIIIGDAVFHEASFVGYYEEHAYMKQTFPVRILTISMSQQDVLKIMRSDKTIQMNRKKMYEVKINLTCFNQDGRVIRSPFNTEGVFYGVVVNQDLKSNFSDSVKPNTAGTSAGEQMLHENQIVLYRKPELNFATNSLVNMNITNGKVFGVLLHGFNQVNNGHRFVASLPKVNPSTGAILIPPTNFMEFVNYLDMEYGLYNTPYSMYVENNLFFLLNTNNTHDITIKEPFTMLISTIKDKHGRSYKPERNSCTIVVHQSAVKRENDAASASETDMVYRYPDGNIEHTNTDTSRSSQVFTKRTNVPRIKRLTPLAREKVKITLEGYGDFKIDMLSFAQINDEREGTLKYRVATKLLKIDGLDSISTALVLFRNMNEN